ncbi:MAG: cysteine desulfurase [Bacilli bacterium]|nr:cysteine desulfurase [Bacilli bacterium]
MIYLDYSATTPVNDEVLDTFVEVNKKFIGNPNSIHKLGVEAKKLIDASSKQISDILKLSNKEIIYTSGASEANNLAIKGICFKYLDRGKHIITTKLEHSSIIETLKYLEKLGYKIDYVKLDSNGLVDLVDLEKLITDDTILVSISSISSELGIRQPIDEIKEIIKKYPKTYFHSDMTQSFGKEIIDTEDIDLISFSSQKFYGLKGIGGLIKDKKIVIEPLIHGGKSTTIYRSGTPSPALIASTAKALRLAYDNLSEKQSKVKELNEYLVGELSKLDIYINSNEFPISNIVNISLKNIKSETMLHALENDEIYVSTKTACSNGDISDSVLTVTNDLERSKTSIRISISHLTSKEDIDKFLESFSNNLLKLSKLNKNM